MLISHWIHYTESYFSFNFLEYQDPVDMVVPTEHALNEAIQVSPLVISDVVRRQKVSKYA